MQFKNKTILITGGATGIGFGFATQLMERSNQVIITGRREDKLRAAQAKLTGLHYFACDISDPASIDNLFLKLRAEGHVLDVVINNAGVLELWDIKNDNLPSVDIFIKISTNLSGPIAVTQQFIRQANHHKDNYIVNITTEAAIMPVPLLPLYSSSKSGLSVFTKSLRVQLADTRFSVVEIVPPATESKMTTEDMKNTTKLADPIIFAGDVIKKIESGQLYYAPSTNAKLLTFIRRVFPHAGLRLVHKLSIKQLIG
ncbi:MAG: SDR family NAD(P)-dependent oxidoreductase [Bacteroidota bacterium]|nr:SDR family NAD(P)-dependent oxidoreductase [Bacteroidota bacterium]